MLTTARRRAALVAGAASAALFLSSCAGSSGSAGKNDEPSFIFISSAPIGQNPFLKSGKAGINAVAKEFDGTAKVFESKGEAQRRSNLEAAIAEDPDVLVMLGFQFGDIAQEVAEENPQQTFLLIDTFIENAPDNLYQATFREQEPSYLLGVEAGLLTETGKVGTVISVNDPLLEKYTAGFSEGAKSINPKVTVAPPQIVGGADPFADAERAKEQALTLAASGADEVFALAASANAGVMEAAAEAGFSAYGVDANQCHLAPGFVVDGTIKSVDTVIETVIGEIMDGKSAAEATSSFGLAEKALTIVSLSDDAAKSQCTVMDHPEILQRVKQTHNDIVNGKITVTSPDE